MFGTEVETIQSGGEGQAVTEEAKHNLAVKFHPTYSLEIKVNGKSPSVIPKNVQIMLLGVKLEL